MTEKQDFYDSYHKKNDKFYKVIGRWNFTYYEILNFFHQFIAPSLDFSKAKILDVGCGVGTMAFYFASKGMKVKGIDVSKRAIDLCKDANTQVGFKNLSFTKTLLKKGKGEYDMVLISEVIEHVEDEKKFLNDIASNLKKDGLLFLTTPSKENFLYRLGFYQKFDKEVGHVRRYTVDSITETLEKNNFNVLNLREVEGPLRNLLFTTRLGFLIRFIRGPLVPLFHFFDHLSILVFGASDIQVLAILK